jgi:hypothetical protein
MEQPLLDTIVVVVALNTSSLRRWEPVRLNSGDQLVSSIEWK